MILFLYYYLNACAALGVAPLGVAYLPEPTRVWAQVCNSCEPRRVDVSGDLIRYGDARFTKIVAEHEACHVYLGHTKEWMMAHFFDAVSAEDAARACTEERFWTSRATEYALAARAREWARRSSHPRLHPRPAGARDRPQHLGARVPAVLLRAAPAHHVVARPLSDPRPDARHEGPALRRHPAVLTVRDEVQDAADGEAALDPAGEVVHHTPRS